MLPWGGGGRACLRDAIMYMFCLRAHRFICIIFFWPMFLSKKYQSPRDHSELFIDHNTNDHINMRVRTHSKLRN
jgi:hypothetical protein